MQEDSPINEKVLEALYAVIDELNLDLAPEKQLAKEPDAALFGGEGPLESIELVRLIVLYEIELSSVTGHALSISDDRAMSDTHSHFGSVGSLARYAGQLVAEEESVG